MIGVAVVRGGRLNPGASLVGELVDEMWLMGENLDGLDAVPASTTRRLEVGAFAPASWSRWLATQLTGRPLVLAAEPDGRDLAGRVAELVGVAVHAGCLELTMNRVVTPRYGGATTVIERPAQQFVATVQLRAHDGAMTVPTQPVEFIDATFEPETTIRELLEPDMDSVDLADAARILAGGAGLGSQESFDLLARLAPRLSAAMGATRVVTDRGWVPFRRQIGTTGATVTPALYVAFGISGAVQHTSGLGAPHHVISVNRDPACPMSQMADVALVADAPATLRALDELVGGS